MNNRDPRSRGYIYHCLPEWGPSRVYEVSFALPDCFIYLSFSFKRKLKIIKKIIQKLYLQIYYKENNQFQLTTIILTSNVSQLIVITEEVWFESYLSTNRMKSSLKKVPLALAFYSSPAKSLPDALHIPISSLQSI